MRLMLHRNFYPGDVHSQLAELLASYEARSDLPPALVAAAVPHAGWRFSGGVAARTLKALAERSSPGAILLLGAVHGWLDASADFERLAPAPFSTVCFRYRPAALIRHQDHPAYHRRLDELNARLIDGVNGSGEVFLSHTRLRDRFAIRIAIGNLRTEARHVERAWALIRREAARLGDG